MKGPGDERTIREAKQLLEGYQKDYAVRSSAFHDVSFGTYMMFELKKASEMNRLIDRFDRHTVRDIIQIIEKAHAENAVRKIDIHEIGRGTIQINLYVNSTMEVSQSNHQYKVYTIQDARELPEEFKVRSAGSKKVYYDRSLGKTSMIVQLDEEGRWRLSLFFSSENGRLQKYCLDYVSGSESYYEFRDEPAIREILYQEGDEDRFLDEVFMRYVDHYSGVKLLEAIKPYITAQYHYE